MDRPFPKLLTISGWVVAVPSAILALRLIWEQTFLTWEDGPQMVGFSLGHSGLILPLLLGIAGGVIWLLVFLVFAVRRRTIGRRDSFLPAVILVFSFILISIPYSLWKQAFVSKLAQSPSASEFLIYASAAGEQSTVESFISHGVAIDLRNREGKTALHGASIAGKLEIVKYLVENGADLDAVSRYGDSPLEYAISQGHDDVARYLANHGAKRIVGSEEQRDKAIAEIVREQMEEIHN